MTPNWLTILCAVLAGGIINQIFTTFFGDRIAFRRDFTKWNREKKYETFCNLITITSSSTPECGLEKWPGKIRGLSQQVYLLHKEGRPPQKICDLLEEIFQLSIKFKNSEDNKEDLREDLRRIGSQLRRELAKSLENDK